jgi:hypothetical protein
MKLLFLLSSLQNGANSVFGSGADADATTYGKAFKVQAAEIASLFDWDLDSDPGGNDEELPTLILEAFDESNHKESPRPMAAQTRSSSAPSSSQKKSNKVEFLPSYWKSFDYGKVDTGALFLLLIYPCYA